MRERGLSARLIFSRKILKVFLATAIILPVTLHGQDDIARVDENEAEVFELPPFMVQPTQGWYASHTLAGTRLNVPVNDLAQQVEIITADFMEDFSLSTLEEASVYTLNLESRNEYFLGNGYTGMDSPGGNLRIRGLGAPSQSSMFFQTGIPKDSYNISRIDIGSGPNPILFGTGAPGGVININLQPAIFKNQGIFKMRFDSNGSYRFELHGNQVVIDDVLAVRCSLLYDQQYWENKPNGELDRRVYATATYKPFKKTLVRVFFEEISIHSWRPNRMFPIDQITPWLFAAELPNSGVDENMPIFQNDLEWLGDVRWADTQVFRVPQSAPVYIVNNGNNGGYTDFVSWRNSAVVRPLEDWDHISPVNADTSGYTFLDDTYYPLGTNIFGNLRHRERKGHVADILINQQLTEELHLEVGFHRFCVQNFLESGLEEMWRVQVDANAFLPDNMTPNPNVGKYYTDGANRRYSDGENYSNDMIANLAYEHNFGDAESEWLRWLGRHSLVGGASKRFEESKHGNYFYKIYPKVLENGDLVFPEIDYVDWYYPYYYDENGNRIQTEEEPKFMEQDNTRIFFRYYLDPANGDYVPSLPFAVGEPLELIDSAGNPFTVDPENTGIFDEEGRRLTVGGPGTNFRNKTRVLQFSYQGYFWKDRLKFTYGWNRTQVKYASPIVQTVDPYTGLVLHKDDVAMGDWWELGELAEGDAQVKGVVLDPFKDWLKLPLDANLQFFGQKSNTFQDNTQYYSPFGEPIPNAIGTSEDKGVILTLFNDRLILRYNRYENSAGPASAGSKPYQKIKGKIEQIEERVRELDPDFPTIEGPYGLGFPVLGGGYQVVSDRKSTGHEISAFWNITRNLELRFNTSFMEVTESNIGKDWWDWMDQRIEMYKMLDVPEGGVYNPEDVDGDGVIGRWTWETARYINRRSESLSERWEKLVIKGQTGKEIIQALEGKSNPFIRSLRFNINIMYRFWEGFLKGSSIGGAFRWRESPLLSYGVMELNGVQVIDLENPLYGTEEYYLDLTMKYRIRAKGWLQRNAFIFLTIQNVLNQDDPIPVMIDVHGEPLQMVHTDGIRFIVTYKMDLW